MALTEREMNGMKNFAGVGQVDQATVTEFVAMVPNAKREKIAETLCTRVQSGLPMNYGDKGMLSLATMAAIAVRLATAIN